MKIAIIVHSFPNVSETFILNHITGLISLGHKVKIFALYNRSGEKNIHSGVNKYNLLDKAVFYKIPQSRVLRLINALFLFFKYFHYTPTKIINSLNPFKFGRQSLSLVLFYLTIPFLKEKFDIIHCHFGPMGIYGSYLKHLGINGKLVISFYGYDLSMYIQKYGINVYNDLFEKGDIFLPICNNFRNILIRLGCDKNKIIIHRIGVDLDKFKYSTKRITKDKMVKLLTIGRLVEKKGHIYAINAIAKVVKRFKNIEYTIAGDGPLRQNLEELVSKLNLDIYIKFIGIINDTDALNLYNISHLFVLPSITAKNGDMEGTPVVLMEASACGLPVISTYHSGIPEVVIDQKSGYLVPEKDVDALADKIEHLINHPEKWADMGREGRKIVEENYDIKKLNLRLVEIYESCLK